MVVYRIVEVNPPLAVRERRRELPLVVLRGSDVRVPDEGRLAIATGFSRCQHFGEHRSPALDLAASAPKRPIDKSWKPGDIEKAQ